MLEFQFIPYWLREFVSGNLWITQVFIVVFLVLFTSFLAKRILARLHRSLEATAKLWDDAIVGALSKPMLLLIWLVGIAFAAEIVRTHTDAEIFQAIGPIRDVGIIATITWFLIRLVRRAEANVLLGKQSTDEEVDVHTVEAIGKLVRMSFVITAVLVTMQTLGYSISGILAFGGIGGIAVGFAAKDLLANFFGGLMIYLDRPFIVGDWIRSPDRSIEGTVENIGWRLTVVRTFDKRPLYVPNSIFANIAVENPSRMTNRRIYETIGIRYEDIDRMPAIVQDVKQMLQDHQDIDSSMTLIVNFNSFAASSLDFFVYAFTHTSEWVAYHAIKQDVLLKISDIITRHGAEIAFPTSTVHLQPESGLQSGIMGMSEIHKAAKS